MLGRLDRFFEFNEHAPLRISVRHLVCQTGAAPSVVKWLVLFPGGDFDEAGGAQAAEIRSNVWAVKGKTK